MIRIDLRIAAVIVAMRAWRNGMATDPRSLDAYQLALVCAVTSNTDTGADIINQDVLIFVDANGAAHFISAAIFDEEAERITLVRDHAFNPHDDNARSNTGWAGEQS